MTDPIVKSVTVPVAKDRAFARFTTELMRWWPVDKFSVAAGQGEVPVKVVVEPRVGGAVYEILRDTTRAEWGVITDWDAPNGFAMTWHPGQGEDVATKIDVAFTDAEGGTKVTLTHSGWAVLAEGAGEAMGRYSSGWDHVLSDCYAARINGA